MFAVLVNEEFGIVEIREYDENNGADNPMYGFGDAWAWVKTFSTMQEAEDYSGCLSFDCTVMRAVDTSPAYEKNYKIVDGYINENQTDDGTVWFPKMHCSSFDEARKLIDSSCRWCRYNNIGIDDSDEKNQEVDIKLPGDDEISSSSEEPSSDDELFGVETLRKLGIAREQRGQ